MSTEQIGSKSSELVFFVNGKKVNITKILYFVIVLLYLNPERNDISVGYFVHAFF